MKSLHTFVLSLLICCAMLHAQAADTSGTIDENAIADAIERRYPHIDLADEHDIRSIRDPQDQGTREAYTQDMITVVRIWISTGQGATLEKIIDAQLDEQRSNAVLCCVAGFFAVSYPPGLNRNNERAEAHYRKAIEIATEAGQDFALARAHLALFLSAGEKLSEARELIDRAAEIRPNDVEILLVKAHIYLVRVRNAEATIEICKHVLDLNPTRERHFNQALDTFKTASKGLSNEYEAYIEKAYASDQVKGERRGRIAYALGLLAIDNQDYERALSLGQAGLDAFEIEDNPVLAIRLHRRLIVEPTGYLATQAEDAGNEELATTLFQELEVHMRKLVELDLEYLGFADLNKVSALIELAHFLHGRDRDQEALEVLQDYDARALLLTDLQRERVRDAMLAVRQWLGLLSVRSWKGLDEEELKRVLLPLVKEASDALRAQKRLPKLADADAFDFFLTKIQSHDRTLAQYALWLGTSSALAFEEDERYDKMRSTIIQRVEDEGDVQTSEQASFITTFLSGLASLPGRNNAEAILEYLDSIVDDADFADNRYKSRVLPGAMNSAFQASKLGSEFRPDRDDKQDTEGYRAWAKRVRAELARTSDSE